MIMCPQQPYYKLSYAGAFHKNSLCMACCTFNVLEVRTITPNRFKNQSCGTLKILAHIPTINKGLLNEKMLFSIIVVLRQNFLNTFIKIAILCKIYQCSNCYAKLKQHWVECICVHNSPISYLFEHKKARALHLSAFSQKCPNSDLLHFRQIQNPNFNTKQIQKSD